jgi:hypothetical protein
MGGIAAIARSALGAGVANEQARAARRTSVPPAGTPPTPRA